MFTYTTSKEIRPKNLTSEDIADKVSIEVHISWYDPVIKIEMGWWGLPNNCISVSAKKSFLKTMNWNKWSAQFEDLSDKELEKKFRQTPEYGRMLLEGLAELNKEIQYTWDAMLFLIEKQ